MAPEKRNLTTKGVPLIKFQEKEFIESIQAGKIYAKTLAYYRNLEEGQGDKCVGDKFEAMLPIHKGQFVSKETGEDTELRDVLMPTLYSNDYVFCMFSCCHKSASFSFSEQQKTELLRMGDTALIITDSDVFCQRVKSAAKENGFEVRFAPVQYYEEGVDNANMIIDMLQGSWTLAFWKRNAYNYQQEARFLFSPHQKGLDHIELDIGDISDISQIVDARSALTALVQVVKSEDI